MCRGPPLNPFEYSRKQGRVRPGFVIVPANAVIAITGAMLKRTSASPLSLRPRITYAASGMPAGRDRHRVRSGAADLGRRRFPADVTGVELDWRIVLAARAVPD